MCSCPLHPSGSLPTLGMTVRLDRETIAYVDPTNGYFEDFGPFDGRVWLNTAHQGPLPKVAREAGKVALEQKVRPHLLRDEDFFEVPGRLRAAPLSNWLSRSRSLSENAFASFSEFNSRCHSSGVIVWSFQ